MHHMRLTSLQTRLHQPSPTVCCDQGRFVAHLKKTESAKNLQSGFPAVFVDHVNAFLFPIQINVILYTCLFLHVQRPVVACPNSLFWSATSAAAKEECVPMGFAAKSGESISPNDPGFHQLT